MSKYKLLILIACLYAQTNIGFNWCHCCDYLGDDFQKLLYYASQEIIENEIKLVEGILKTDVTDEEIIKNANKITYKLPQSEVIDSNNNGYNVMLKDIDRSGLQQYFKDKELESSKVQLTNLLTGIIKEGFSYIQGYNSIAVICLLINYKSDAFDVDAAKEMFFKLLFSKEINLYDKYPSKELKGKGNEIAEKIFKNEYIACSLGKILYCPFTVWNSDLGFSLQIRKRITNGLFIYGYKFLIMFCKYLKKNIQEKTNTQTIYSILERTFQQIDKDFLEKKDIQCLS